MIQLVLKFDETNESPKFNLNSTDNFSEGLVITRSPQCPYSVKNVDAIIQSAQKMNLKATLIELEDYVEAQNSPCAFGTFCILNDGEILSHHPISNTRFENIMKTKSNLPLSI